MIRTTELIGLLLQHSCGSATQIAPNIWAAALPSEWGHVNAEQGGNGGGIVWWIEDPENTESGESTEDLVGEQKNYIPTVFFWHEDVNDGAVLALNELGDVEKWFEQHLDGEF